VAYSTNDLTAVQRAIAKGELEVEFSDRRVRYRSIDELIKAESRISQALRTGNRQKQSKLYAEKGF
jgi:hypothetical protein